MDESKEMMAGVNTRLEDLATVMAQTRLVQLTYAFLPYVDCSLFWKSKPYLAPQGPEDDSTEDGSS